MFIRDSCCTGILGSPQYHQEGWRRQSIEITSLKLGTVSRETTYAKGKLFALSLIHISVELCAEPQEARDKVMVNAKNIDNSLLNLFFLILFPLFRKGARWFSLPFLFYRYPPTAASPDKGRCARCWESRTAWPSRFLPPCPAVADPVSYTHLALGMLDLLEKNDNGDAANNYNVTLAGAPDEIVGKIVSGDLDLSLIHIFASGQSFDEGGFAVVNVTGSSNNNIFHSQSFFLYGEKGKTFCPRRLFMFYQQFKKIYFWQHLRMLSVT